MRILISFSLIVLLIFNSTAQSVSNGKNGMVVTAEPLATKVGVSILKKGGNAVDAAVAVGFALAVTYPVAGNIGGGGYMVIHFKDGQSTTIDYREVAPLLAHKNMYLDEKGNFIKEKAQEGPLSGGIPGSVAGLLYALEKYGTLPLNDVITPAILLAEDGFQLSSATAKSFENYNKDFNKFLSTKKIFTNHGQPFQEGLIFKQFDLANVLKEIREKGREGFYDGNVAEKIVNAVNKDGGIFTLEDFKNYYPIERVPIKGDYRGYEIISMPPSSSGGVALIQLLNILENINLASLGWGSSEYFHFLTEAMRSVYADRSKYLGDPAFYNVPVDLLISKEYASHIFKQIGNKARKSKDVLPGNNYNKLESEQTTHYSIIDKDGNAVSVTTTINSGYGSKYVVDGCGFFLNNEMDDFAASPNTPNQFGLLGGEANSIEPGKRMLSSMTPTIVLKDGKPFLVVGTPGGSTIITVVLQVILNCIDFEMDAETANSTARIHHQWYPDEIQYEKFGLSKDVIANLELKGHKIGKQRTLGLVELIYVDLNTGLITGCSDKRGSGKAEGF